MGLATPTSIMVGTGRAAEMGVLFRKGEALQQLKDARVVAVDKTGTLTKGRPELTDLIVADGFDRDRVLAQVAAVEIAVGAPDRPRHRRRGGSEEHRAWARSTTSRRSPGLACAPRPAAARWKSAPIAS